MRAVGVEKATNIPRLREEALSDPAKFAEWPIGLTLPPHQREWLRLSQLYKTDPKYRKIIVLAPTGSGKTTVWDVVLPIYELCLNRGLKVGLVGSSAYNVRPKLAAISRQLLDNEDLIAAYGYRDSEDKEQTPRFQPKKATRWTIDEIRVVGASTDAHSIDPSIACFGWESKMEGRHWDLFVGDDVTDYIEVQSGIYREQQRAWYENVVKHRMKPNAREFWIGTRSHAGDLLGYLMDSGEYTVIDEPQAIVIDPVTNEEKSYWPEMFSIEQLQKERDRDPVSFALKRMNQIVGSGITEFPKADIEKCKDKRLAYYGNRQNLPKWLKDKDLRFYAGVDLGGVVATRESKYFVIYVAAVDKASGNRYLVHLVRTKTGVAEQRAKVKEAYAAWGVSKILVENNSLQAYFYEDAFEGLPVEGLQTGSNKVSLEEGIPTLVSLAKAGKLHIPWEDAYAQTVSSPFIKELEDYPHGETGDIVMAWWFTEREARKLFFEAGSVSEHRNFFRRRRPIAWRNHSKYMRG